MFASHLSQAMVLDGAEPPEIATGFETIVGDYEFNPSHRDDDIQILAVILKYIPGLGAFPLKANSNPTTTVIYRRNSDNKVSYFDLHRYTKGSDGYGYENKLSNTNLLVKDNFISKDVKFQTSPAHKDGMYAMGLNANTAYISLDSVTEDAFVISESLARKMQSTAIRTINFQVGVNQIPLNLYGNENEYKFMPDIGESIRADGIICGFRKPDDISFVSDTQIDALSRPQPLHDILYFAQQTDGVIIDINIYVNKKHKIPKNIYYQIQKYQEQNVRYHTAVIDAYTEVKHRGYEITETFNSLVARNYALLRASGASKIPELAKKPNITLVQKKDPIEFLSISITYAYPNVVSSGYKFTGRNGDKGVACKICPDEEMPIDDFGMRVHLIIDPTTILNRMNSGQSYVQDLSRCNQFMRWRIEHMVQGGDPRIGFTRMLPTGVQTPIIPPVADDVNCNTPFDLLMNYFHDVNPNYAELILRDVIKTEQDKIDLINYVIHRGIYLVIPPFLKHLGPVWMLELERKYPAPTTSLILTTIRRDGRKKIDRTRIPICVGAKYIYCLYKIPHLKAAGPAYINQHKTPIHPSTHAKLQYPIAQTPLRHGEDEIRNQVMAVGSPATARMMALYANSSEGVDMLMRELITSPHPTQLDRVNMTTRELIETNNINRTMQHLFSTFGVNILQQVGPGEPRYDYYQQLLVQEQGKPAC